MRRRILYTMIAMLLAVGALLGIPLSVVAWWWVADSAHQLMDSRLKTISDQIIRQAEMGEHLDVTYLVTFTQSGDTVRRLARLHTPLPLLAFTPLPAVRSQLTLTWGTETFLTDRVTETARAGLSDADARVVHLRIGRRLVELGDDRVFEAARHVGLGGAHRAIRDGRRTGPPGTSACHLTRAAPHPDR